MQDVIDLLAPTQVKKPSDVVQQSCRELVKYLCTNVLSAFYIKLTSYEACQLLLLKLLSQIADFVIKAFACDFDRMDLYFIGGTRRSDIAPDGIHEILGVARQGTALVLDLVG